MEPEMILQADILDIIFDNRNKEYGAYELRSHYESRVRKSLLIVMLLFISLISAGYLKNYLFPDLNHRNVRPEIPETTLVTLDKVKQDPLPRPVIRPQKKMEQIKDTKPIITRALVVEPPPTVKELDGKMISSKNELGDLPGKSDVVQPNGMGQASGNPAQTSSMPVEEEKTFRTAEYMPEYPGGMEALRRFLAKNLKMPREDLEPGTHITELLRFVVDKNGAVTDIEILKTGGREFDKEVERVIRKMPTWIPGRQNGRNVAVYFHLPVVFQVPNEN
ncbi:MAG: TonB family protein [Bacteroidetes bacterium]|nr:TonB family protein [Bacteroidota bacterium]